MAMMVADLVIRSASLSRETFRARGSEKRTTGREVKLETSRQSAQCSPGQTIGRERRLTDNLTGPGWMHQRRAPGAAARAAGALARHVALRHDASPLTEAQRPARPLLHGSFTQFANTLLGMLHIRRTLTSVCS